MHDDEAGFLRAIERGGGDPAPGLVYADWLDECGRHAEAAHWRAGHLFPAQGWPFPIGSGSGHGDSFSTGDDSRSVTGSDIGKDYGNGYGYGDGDGSDVGDGRHDFGSGIGYEGFGDRSGSGIGYEGSGDSFGTGDGWGYGIDYEPGVSGGSEMEVGKSYMILCGRGFAFCGRAAAEVRPNVYRLAQASMLCTKRDCSWFDLAEGNGDARKTMTSRFSAGDVIVGPEIHFAVPWAGELPEGNVG